MTIEVPVPVEKAADLLRRHVEPFQWLYSSYQLPFRGKVFDSGFRIMRNANYRNSFQPVLYGRFESRKATTIVRVRMTLHPLILALLVYGVAFLAVFTVIACHIFAAENDPTFLLAAGALGSLTYLLILGGFWFETPKSKRQLLSALELPPPKPSPDY